MAMIRVEDFNHEVITEFPAPLGTSLADVLMDKWPNGPRGGVVICDPDGREMNAARVCQTWIADGETYTVRLMPQGIEIGISTWILMAVSAAALVLLRPQLPNVANQSSYEWDDSDRPQFLSGQQNKVKPGSRIPDAFGNIRVYPDLVSTPAIEYEGNNQQIEELYVVSRGRFEATEEKFFDDELTDVSGGTIRYYYPGELWPADFPIVRPNASVAGVELPAENETFASGETMRIRGNTMVVDRDGYWDGFDAEMDGFEFMPMGLGSNNLFPQRVSGISADGRTLTVRKSFPTPEDIVVGNFRPVRVSFVEGGNNPTRRKINEWKSFNSTYREASGPNYDDKVNSSTPRPFQQINVTTGRIQNRTTKSYNNHVIATSGNRDTGTFFTVITPDSVAGGWNADLPGSGYVSPIFNVPGQSTEAWLDFEFPQGLYQQSAGQSPRRRTVKIEVNWRQRSIDGIEREWQTTTFSFAERTRTPRRYTRKIVFDTTGQYEIYCRRITSFVTDNDELVTADAVRWIGLLGRQDVTELTDDVLNVTLARVSLANQSLATGAGSRRFNVIGDRQLYSYRNEDWRLTRTMSDAIMHTLVDMGNVPRTNIDEASLYRIQDELDAQGPNDGEFSAVVDQTMTVEDQVQLIAGVSRTMVYRRGGTFYFRRLRGGETPSTLINARNKIEPERKTLTFGQQNDPDAVIIRYQNREKNYREDTYQWPDDIVSINPEEQTVIGLCDPISISRLAQYSYNKRKYERDTVSITMMDEGAMLSPGDVVAVTDFLREASPVEGELLRIDGDVGYFDEPIPAGDWVLRVRDDAGRLVVNEAVSVTSPGPTQTLPVLGGLQMPDSGATTGLLYSFEEIQSDNRDLFYVVRIAPTREGSVEVEGLLYRDETFAGDTNTVVQRSVKRIEAYDKRRA